MQKERRGKLEVYMLYINTAYFFALSRSEEDAKRLFSYGNTSPLFFMRRGAKGNPAAPRGERSRTSLLLLDCRGAKSFIARSAIFVSDFIKRQSLLLNRYAF